MYQRTAVINDTQMLIAVTSKFEVRADGFNCVGRGSTESEALTDFQRQMVVYATEFKIRREKGDLAVSVENPRPKDRPRVISVGVEQGFGMSDEARGDVL